MVCSVISFLFKREPSGDFKQWGWMSLRLEKTATTVCQSNGRGGLECTEIVHISVMGLKPD